MKNELKNTSRKSKKTFYTLMGLLIIINIITFIYVQSSSNSIDCQAEDAMQYLSDNTEVQPVQEVVTEAPKQYEIYTVTAYCSCQKCCGKWALNRPDNIVIGAAGVELKENHSVASSLPLGTKIEISGLGEFVVEDRVADFINERYDGKIIDIYFNNHEDAKVFGKQEREVFVYGK